MNLTLIILKYQKEQDLERFDNILVIQVTQINLERLENVLVNQKNFNLNKKVE